MEWKAISISTIDNLHGSGLLSCGHNAGSKNRGHTDTWCAWQFNRPELGKGFAVFIRRLKSPHEVFTAQLQGLDPKVRYEVTFAESFDIKLNRAFTGEALRKLPIEISSSPGTMRVRYRKTALR